MEPDTRNRGKTLGDTPIREEMPSHDEPDLLIWTPRAKKAPVPQVTTDTVRVDTARVRETASAPQAPEPAPKQKKQEPEPFSENWEPEYDEPIGEYVPPEPIQFRPRSRLGSMKRKLMDGPEQRYNALCEKGVVKLQVALFACMLIVVLAVSSIVLHRLDMVRPDRMRLLVFGELFAMLFSATLCWERLVDGLIGMFRGRFSTDTLLAFSFAACIADGIFCLQEVKVPFCAAFSLEALMCLWSEYQKRSTEICQMDTLRKANRLSRITMAPDCHEGRPGFAVTDGQPEDFMDTYAVPSAPRKAMDRFALAALIASLAVAAAAGIHGGLRVGVRAWSAAILAACPATALICLTRPAWTLERRLHRFGSVLCGWQGVKAAAGRAVVPVTDEDLLPTGTVKINGVRFYSRKNPDTILAYATAVMVHSESCLTPLFEHLRKTRKLQSYEIEAFKTYADKGLGAIICGERVLVGSQEFLRSMGITIPPGTRVNPGIYVSIGREFACIMGLAFGKLKGTSAGLSALCSHRGLTPVLASTNFVLSETFLKERYRVDTRRMIFPAAPDRERLAQWKPQENLSAPCALITQEGLAGTAFAISGARNLRTASVAGAAVHILGGILGLLAVLVLTLTNRTDLMTPANLLLFELIWAIPGLMFSEWTRII